VTQSYTGEVVATRTSELGFERSGKIIWLRVDRGDRVLVRAMLQPSDTVILDGVQRIVPGQLVRRVDS
jgi:hypothetical protein